MSNFLKRNSSTILTILGGAGLITTAIMSGRDTIKATKKLEEKKKEGIELNKKEIIKTVLPEYIPTIISGCASLACVFGANVLNRKSQASLVSAYALLNSSYQAYKNKASELYGDDANTKIQNGIASNYYEENTPSEVSNEKEIFFDFYGLQFFESTMREVKEAEKELNRILHMKGTVNLGVLYKLLGIETTNYDYEVGWSTSYLKDCGYDNIILGCDKVKGEDDRDFIVMAMLCDPTSEYLTY